MIYVTMNDAVSVKAQGDAICIDAPPGTDFFIDGGTGAEKTNAPFYHTAIEGDFILRCEVQPHFKNTYDAGCLCAYESPTKWIKLAFEKTDLGYESIVSVVTDEASDDCNGEKIKTSSVWLQIVRKNNMWCLHHSKDGSNWKMSRYFNMAMNRDILLGMLAQSPAGDGCLVDFRHFAVEKNIYRDIRFAR